MGRVVDIPAPIGQARLQIVEGELLHRQDETRTDVTTHTSGGGGYVHPTYGGYISAPTTRTTVRQRRQHRLWIAERDGTRHEFVLKNDQCDFAAAAGQRLRVVKGGAVNGTQASLLWARNLTLGQAFAFQDGDLWAWATEHGLARYPLLYRIVFRWSLWLLAAYVLLFWAPLTELWKRLHAPVHLHTFGDFVQLNLTGLAQWSPSVVVQAYAAQDIRVWLGMGMALLGLLLVWAVLEMLGYIAFGWWWRRLVQRPFRDRVVAAYGG